MKTNKITMALVPYGSYHIEFTLDEILSGYYSLDVLMAQKINSALVLARLKSTSEGHWLLSVSIRDSKDVRHILAEGIKAGEKTQENKKTKIGDVEGFDFVHNMVYIVEAPWDTYRSKSVVDALDVTELSGTPSDLYRAKHLLGITVFYDVNEIELIIEESFLGLNQRLDTLKYHLGLAIETKQRVFLSNKITALEMDINYFYRKTMIEKINRAASSVASEIEGIKWNLNSVAREIKKVKRNVKKCDGKLETYLESLKIKLDASAKELKEIDMEYSSIMVDISKYIDFEAMAGWMKYSLASGSLWSYVETHFSHLVNSEKNSEEKMPGILKEFTMLELEKATPLEMAQFVDLLGTIYSILQTIGRKEGFVSTLDLTNAEAYPLINTLVGRVLDFNYGLDKQPHLSEKDRAAIIVERVANPVEYYKKLAKKWSEGTLVKYYNLIANLTSLQIYSMLEYSMIIMGKNALFHLGFVTLRSKAKKLAKVVLSSIDKDIRGKIRSKNSRISKTILAGYDTEYQGVEISKVKRLSAQLACGAELQILIPKRNKYLPEGVNSSTGEKYKKSPIPQEGCDLEKAVEWINKSIDFVWNQKYGKKERVFNLISKLLVKHPQVRLVESEDSKLFTFPIRNSEGKRKIKTTFVDLARLDEDNVKELKKKGGSVSSVSVTKVLKNNKGGSVSWKNTDKDGGSVSWRNSDKIWTFSGLINDYIIPSFSSELDGLCSDLIDLIRRALDKNLENFSDFVSYSKKGEVVESCYETGSNPKEFDITEVESEDLQVRTKTYSKFKHSNRYRIEGFNFGISRNITLLSHFNAAEFSLFDDFEDIKKEFKILQKSFVTMGLPLNVKPHNWKVTTRDSILLSPAGASLEKVGQMHGLAKTKIDSDEINNMESLKATNLDRFKEYAVTDAYITLYHGLYILDFVRSTTYLNKIPPTLSSVGRLNLLAHWKKNEYRGYKLDLDGLGETPKGMNVYGQPLINNNLYLAALKGGRNEGLMYGKDTTTTWYDWDAKGCYTTCMAGMGNPDYSKAKHLYKHDKFETEELAETCMAGMGNPDYSKAKVIGRHDRFESDKRKELLLNSFTVMNVDFEYPSTVKFPSLCTDVDKHVSIYPRKGNTTCTGIEYLAAQNRGAKLVINNGCMIPFEVSSEEGSEGKLINQPFASFVKTVQDNRLKYGKGHPSEQLWKFLGNMVYGQTCQGLSGRKSLDTTTGTMVAVRGSELSSAVIGSWITGNARALMGETMNNIDTLGYKVVSVTTDGFITNMGDLEEGIITEAKKGTEGIDTTCLEQFRRWRESLGHGPVAYELKTAMVGMNSWSTRGQLGVKNIEEYGGTIAAATGYQRKGKTHVEFLDVIEKALSSSEKEISFMQSSLRGANTIFKKGGHVTMSYAERRFRVSYDNKRELITPDLLKRDLDVLEKALGKVLSGSSEEENPQLSAKSENSKEEEKGRDLTVILLAIEDKKTEISKLEALMSSHIKKGSSGESYIDFSCNEGLILDTRPHENVGRCRASRFISGRYKTAIYESNDYNSRILPPLSTNEEIMVRILMRDFIDRKGRYKYKYGLFSEKLSTLEFVELLGRFEKRTGGIFRLTQKYIAKMTEYLEGLKLQGGFIPRALNKYDHKKLFDLATEIFPDGYLDYSRLFYN